MLSLPEKIITERLLLQRLRYEDAEEIFYSYASKPEATRFVSWPTHRSIDDTRKFLALTVPAWDRGVEFSYSVRLKPSARLVGSIGVVNMDTYLQFGYIFSPTQWGKGFATEACRAVLRELVNLPEAMAISTFVDVSNVFSIRVLEKCGLRRDGIFPKWFQFPNQNNASRDCILFSVPPAEHADS
jgi:[ribosomal protein S5]-alanine N-acetyltransferase